MRSPCYAQSSSGSASSTGTRFMRDALTLLAATLHYVIYTSAAPRAINNIVGFSIVQLEYTG